MRTLFAAILLTGIVCAQPNWIQQTPSTPPAARGNHAMAWDGQQVVLFGGGTGSAFSAETWLWNGSQWSLANPAHSPSARQNINMAYDPVRNQLVLFGGYGNSGALGDTWVWNGTDWTDMTPSPLTTTNSPSPRWFARLAYDAVNQEIVLFGGRNSPAAYNDVWTWNGSSWTQRIPAHPIPALTISPVMAWDPTGQQILLFGGIAGGQLQRNMWSWKNYDFTQLSVTTPPSRAESSNFVADTSNQLSVLYGGSGVLDDTWTWDGSAWTQQLPAISPGPPVGSYRGRGAHAMAFDPVRRQVVLFGGADAFGDILNDTWTYTPSGQPGTVQITVPTGVQFTFNGVNYTGSQSIPIAPGTYSLTTLSPQSLGSGSQSRFVSWSDGGAQTHNVTVGAAGVNITGVFQVQYLLTLSASPANGGLIGSLGGPYYDAGASVQVTAIANPGFTFAGWAGACSGSNGCTVTMNAPVSVIASFNSQTFNLTINVPAGVHYTLSGFPFAGSATVALPQGTYTVSLVSPQAVGTGVQTAFVSWSDGGAQTHDIVLGAAAKSVTATFKTQYQVTVATTPANQGTAGFFGGPFFDAGSSLVITATANPGYNFQYWTGGCTGSNPFCVAIVNVPLNVVAHFSVPYASANLTPASAPTPRIGYAMAYDPGRQEVVLFGGFSVRSLTDPGGKLLDDTWTWNGATWTQQFPAVHPSARSAHSMAYHAGLQSVILCGGDLGLAPGTNHTPVGSNEVWAWNGQLRTWTQKASFPINRINPFLTSYGNNMLLFGGMEPSHQTGGAVDQGNLYNDTWLFDGTIWTQINTAHAPSPRYNGSIAYDTVRGQVVLSGGGIDILDGATVYYDTWIFNGNDWQQAHPATTLTDSLVAAAFDTSLQQVVGLPISGTGNMWTWDGADWTKREAQMPVFDIAYDAARQQVMGVGYVPLGGGYFANLTCLRVPAKTSLVLSGAPNVTLDPATNEYVASVFLANQGNIPITAVTVNLARLALTTSGSIILNENLPLMPGQTLQVLARFPHNSASGRTVLTLTGTYAAPPLTNSAAWSVTVAVNLP